MLPGSSFKLLGICFNMPPSLKHLALLAFEVLLIGYMEHSSEPGWQFLHYLKVPESPVLPLLACSTVCFWVSHLKLAASFITMHKPTSLYHRSFYFHGSLTQELP